MDKLKDSYSPGTHRCYKCKEDESRFNFYEDYFTEECWDCESKKTFSYIEAKPLRGMNKREIESLERRKELFISKTIFDKMLGNLNKEDHTIDLNPFKLKDVVKEFLQGKVTEVRITDDEILDLAFDPRFIDVLSKVWVLGTVVKITKSFILLRHSTLQHIPSSKGIAYSRRQYSIVYTHIYVKLDKETLKVISKNQMKIGELFFAKGTITRYKKDGNRDFQYGIENLTEVKVFSRFLSLMFRYRPEDKYPTISFNDSLIEKENTKEIEFPYHSNNEKEYYNPKGKYRYPVLDGYLIYELTYDQGWKLSKLPQRKYPSDINKYTSHTDRFGRHDIFSKDEIYKYEYFHPAMFIEELHGLHYREHLLKYGIEQYF